VCDVGASIGIAVVIGRGHWFAGMGSVARRPDGGGSDALVLFHRLHRPGFHREQPEMVPGVNSPVPACCCGGCIILLYRQLRADILREG